MCELAGTACLLLPLLQAGIPAGEGGEAALPRGETHLAAVGGELCCGLCRGGRGPEGMTVCLSLLCLRKDYSKG